MPSFKSNMSEWSGAYAAPRPVTAKEENSDVWGELAAKVVPGLLDAAGKGYAIAKGSNILGDETTAVEQLQTVKDFEAAAPFAKDEGDTPDRKAEIEDMRRNALKKYGTNDRKIQALVSAGKISTLEANARRHQLIQENLSNPILAMFKEDFMDASTAFTGGGGKAAEEYFGAYLPTEEERVTLEAAGKIVTAKAKTEEAIAMFQESTGGTREAALSFFKEQAEKENRLAEAEYNHKMRGFTSQESFVAGMQVIDNFMFNTGAQLAQYAASGKKIDDPVIVKGQIDLAVQEATKRLSQFATNMTPEDYGKARAALKTQADHLYAIVDDSDSFKAYEKAVKRITLGNEAATGRAFANISKNLGDVLLAYKVSKEFGDVYVKAQSGDMGAEFQMESNPLMKRIRATMPHVNTGDATTDANNKLLNNNSEGWSISSGVAAFMEMLTPGNAVGVTKVMHEAPDAARQALKYAAQNPETSLKTIAHSNEWMVNSRTPEGAKITAMAIEEFVSRAKASQLLNEKGIPENIQIKGMPQIDSFTGQPTGEVHYMFNTKDLTPEAKQELGEAYKILTKSPQTLQALGYTTPEEFITQAFKKKNK